MLIKNKNIKNGIYIKICEKESIEEFMLNLFNDLVILLPIAQNILYCSKETPNEEIQAFLSRAILCDYNTIFVFVINDYLSDNQKSIINNYIDILLSHQNKQNSCLVFVCDKKNKEEMEFLYNIEQTDFIEMEKLE